MTPTYDDRALVLGETLILSDLHLGRGTGGDLELPIGSSADVVERFEALVERHEPETIVIAGDLLHSFRTIPRTVEQSVAGLQAVSDEADSHLLVTPGNHDTMLDSVWAGSTENEVRIGKTVVCHGHERPETDADRYVIGHDHPTITIEGQRRACYLVGDFQYRDATVVMLPSFNRLNAGVEINRMRAADFQSPLITDADRLEPIVWDENSREPLSFPPLGEFRQML